MLVRIGDRFRIDDYYTTNDGTNITLVTSVKPDFDVLRQSKTLNVIPMVKTAKVVTVAPKEGDFLYVRNRAVSAGNVIEKKDGYAELIPVDEFYKFFEKYAKVMRGPNDNGDFFSHEELMKKYKTFVGKAAFVDHDNENVEKARGIILDAHYNMKGKYIELLKAVDKKAYPELARGIELGYITDTSMGCRCGHSLCSVCMNKAVTEDQFCDHILNYKGSTYNGLPVFEDNREIEFFEDSFVTTGADKQAKILEKVASLGRHNSVKSIAKDPYNNELMKKIAMETNQRSRDGRIQSLAENLGNLPWS